MSSDKRQFLDPISTIGKVILLHFSPIGTKLRIVDHTIQLVEPSNIFDLVAKNWYRDNRGDICVLYPIFIRYIKLYLHERKKKLEQNNNNFNFIDNKSDNELTNEEKCYKYLKKLGEYSIYGIRELQKTYNYDNAVLALQYYILLINHGINDNFSDDLLPDHLKELVKTNLLDDNKVQKIWDDSHVIQLAKTIEACFEAEKNKDKFIMENNKKTIMNMLQHHDEIFKKMLENDNSL